MNTNKIKNTIKGLGVASAMAFGIIMFTGSSANAQVYRGDRDRDNDRYEQRNRQYNNRDYNNNNYNSREVRNAMERGYREGLKQGERAARSRRGGYGNNNGGYYGNNNGYYGNNNGYGNRIQQAYQEGFQRGYREGFNRGQSNRRGGMRWPF